MKCQYFPQKEMQKINVKENMSPTIQINNYFIQVRHSGIPVFMLNLQSPLAYFKNNL